MQGKVTFSPMFAVAGGDLCRPAGMGAKDAVPPDQNMVAHVLSNPSDGLNVG